MMPQGFVFQFHLLSTWGDLYYTGLNGIELYDAAGHKIPLTEKSTPLFLTVITYMYRMHSAHTIPFTEFREKFKCIGWSYVP